MITEFDKQYIFDSEIRPKLQQIMQICNREKMPMFFAVCTKNNNNETEYEKHIYSSQSNEIYLKEDLFRGFVNVTNGFNTVPPIKEIEIDFE